MTETPAAPAQTCPHCGAPLEDGRQVLRGLRQGRGRGDRRGSHGGRGAQPPRRRQPDQRGHGTPGYGGPGDRRRPRRPASSAVARSTTTATARSAAPRRRTARDHFERAARAVGRRRLRPRDPAPPQRGRDGDDGLDGPRAVLVVCDGVSNTVGLPRRLAGRAPVRCSTSCARRCLAGWACPRVGTPPSPGCSRTRPRRGQQGHRGHRVRGRAQPAVVHARGGRARRTTWSLLRARRLPRLPGCPTPATGSMLTVDDSVAQRA